ncbi:MAG: Mur ligase family protein, partial [bacterium]
MLLKELLSGMKIKKISGNTHINVNGITQDSREVEPGNIFVAVAGLKLDGSSYIHNALAKGAKIIVTEKIMELPDGVVGIFVPDDRVALAELSNNFYDSPSEQLKIVGITGTNGKTTTSFFLDSIFETAGFRPGLLGTVAVKIAALKAFPGDGRIIPSKLTTPDATDLQRFFRQMVNDGVTHVSMEVSSHALALNRVTGVHFTGGIFTNLSHDHLDFHKNMEEYFKAKRKLFDILE